MLVDFYHLAASPIDRVLPSICEKVLTAGERLLILADEPELARLDALLWSYAPDSFVPHARRDRPNPEGQPILLSDAPDPINGSTNVALADGRWREEALAFARTFYFFGPAHLDGARATWRGFKGSADVEARYWKQDERGKWIQGP